MESDGLISRSFRARGVVSGDVIVTVVIGVISGGIISQRCKLRGGVSGGVISNSCRVRSAIE